MNKKSAMSAIGYAICSVIILGILMIVSAPMMVDNFEADKKSANSNEFQAPREESYNSGNSYELNEMLNRLSSRIDDLERNQSGSENNHQTVTEINKYICSMEGYLDQNGEVVPIDNPNRTDKLVFVCEYKHY